MVSILCGAETDYKSLRRAEVEKETLNYFLKGWRKNVRAMTQWGFVLRMCFSGFEYVFTLRGRRQWKGGENNW